MKRKRWAGWMAMTVVVVACGGAERGPDVPVRVVVQPFLSFAPIQVAEAMGYFDAQGIAIEWVRTPTTEQSVPLLVAGDLDVLPGLIVPGVLNAMVRGEPIRAVAEKGYLDPDACSPFVIFRPGAAAADSVEIRRVSLDRQAPMWYFVERALAWAEYDLETLEPVFISHAAEAEALRTGTVDAAFAGEPWVARTEQLGVARRWIEGADALPGFQFGVLYFGRRLLRDDPELGERFVVAYLQAVRQLMKGKTPENVAVLAEATGEHPSLLREACWFSFRPDGDVDFTSVRTFQEWALGRGLIDAIVPADGFWDGRFIEHANAVLSAVGQ